VALAEVRVFDSPGALVEGVGFDGEFDSLKVAEFASKLRSLALEGKYSAGRVVGKGGVVSTLSKMSLGGYGVEISEGDFTGETFYQVVLEVTDSQLLEVQKSFDVQVIGHTIEGELRIGNDVKTVSEIKSLYQRGWKENFEVLS